MRALSIAATGMQAQQTNVETIANNLANMNTTGFKQQRAEFEDLLYQNIRQPGAQSTQQTQLPTGLQVGTGVKPVATEKIFTQGNMQQTNNNNDLAINGSGFFQITMPDGSFAYTRDGSFQVSSTGQLVNSSGFALSPAITVPATAQSLTVASDGVVSVTLPNSVAVSQIGAIQLATFINPAGLQAKGGNLYVETAASGTPTTVTPGSTGSGTISQGFVETSNVNVVEEMVNMIQTQRAYEINSKSITTSDQMLQKLAQMS